jgi:hypothetical protein
VFAAILSFIKWGDPFYGVTLSDIEVALALQFHRIEILNKVYSSLYWNNWIPIYFIPFIIIGLVFGAIKRKHSYLAIAIFSLICYYSYKMLTGTLEPFWRYFSVAMIFAIPYLFYFLKEWMSSFLLLVLVFILLPYWSIHKIDYIIKDYSPLPKGFKESAIFFKRNSSPKDKFILSMNPYNDDDLWISKCGRTMDSNSFSNWYPGMNITTFRQPFTVQKLKKKIIEEKFEWLVIDQAFAIDSLFKDKEFKNYYSSVNKQIDTIGNIVLIKIKH